MPVASSVCGDRDLPFKKKRKRKNAVVYPLNSEITSLSGMGRVHFLQTVSLSIAQQLLRVCQAGSLAPSPCLLAGWKDVIIMNSF